MLRMAKQNLSGSAKSKQQTISTFPPSVTKSSSLWLPPTAPGKASSSRVIPRNNVTITKNRFVFIVKAPVENLNRGAKLYYCSECGLGDDMSGNLYKHMSLKHPLLTVKRISECFETRLQSNINNNNHPKKRRYAGDSFSDDTYNRFDEELENDDNENGESHKQETATSASVSHPATPCTLTTSTNRPSLNDIDITSSADKCVFVVRTPIEDVRKGKKLYKCSECDIEDNNRGSLYQHMKDKHKELTLKFLLNDNDKNRITTFIDDNTVHSLGNKLVIDEFDRSRNNEHESGHRSAISDRKNEEAVKNLIDFSNQDIQPCCLSPNSNRRTTWSECDMNPARTENQDEWKKMICSENKSSRIQPSSCPTHQTEKINFASSSGNEKTVTKIKIPRGIFLNGKKLMCAGDNVSRGTDDNFGKGLENDDDNIENVEMESDKQEQTISTSVLVTPTAASPPGGKCVIGVRTPIEDVHQTEKINFTSSSGNEKTVTKIKIPRGIFVNGKKLMCAGDNVSRDTDDSFGKGLENDDDDIENVEIESDKQEQTTSVSVLVTPTAASFSPTIALDSVNNDIDNTSPGEKCVIGVRIPIEDVHQTEKINFTSSSGNDKTVTKIKIPRGIFLNGKKLMCAGDNVSRGTDDSFGKGFENDDDNIENIEMESDKQEQTTSTSVLVTPTAASCSPPTALDSVNNDIDNTSPGEKCVIGVRTPIEDVHQTEKINFTSSSGNEKTVTKIKIPRGIFVNGKKLMCAGDNVSRDTDDSFDRGLENDNIENVEMESDKRKQTTSVSVLVTPTAASFSPTIALDSVNNDIDNTSPGEKCVIGVRIPIEDVHQTEKINFTSSSGNDKTVTKIKIPRGIFLNGKKLMCAGDNVSRGTDDSFGKGFENDDDNIENIEMESDKQEQTTSTSVLVTPTAASCSPPTALDSVNNDIDNTSPGEKCVIGVRTPIEDVHQTEKINFTSSSGNEKTVTKIKIPRGIFVNGKKLMCAGDNVSRDTDDSFDRGLENDNIENVEMESDKRKQTTSVSVLVTPTAASCSPTIALDSVNNDIDNTSPGEKCVFVVRTPLEDVRKGKMLYCCSECGIEANNLGSLYQHMKDKHKEITLKMLSDDNDKNRIKTLSPNSQTRRNTAGRNSDRNPTHLENQSAGENVRSSENKSCSIKLKPSPTHQTEKINVKNVSGNERTVTTIKTPREIFLSCEKMFQCSECDLANNYTPDSRTRVQCRHNKGMFDDNKRKTTTLAGDNNTVHSLGKKLVTDEFDISRSNKQKSVGTSTISTISDLENEEAVNNIIDFSNQDVIPCSLSSNSYPRRNTTSCDSNVNVKPVHKENQREGTGVVSSSGNKISSLFPSLTRHSEKTKVTSVSGNQSEKSFTTIGSWLLKAKDVQCSERDLAIGCTTAVVVSKHAQRKHDKGITSETLAKSSLQSYPLKREKNPLPLDRKIDNIVKIITSTPAEVSLGEMPFKCSECGLGKIFTGSLYVHMENSHPELVMERLAGYDSNYLTDKAHRDKHAGNSSGMEDKTVRAIDVHTKVGQRLHKCSQCSYVSPFLSGVYNHMRKNHKGFDILKKRYDKVTKPSNNPEI